MPVKINDVQIAPAPIVTFSKTYVNNLGSGVIGAEYTINLAGTLIAYKGNPEATGVDPTVILSSGSQYGDFNPDNDQINSLLPPSAYATSIMKKQEQLRSLVASGLSSNSGVKLEIIGFNESKGIKAHCDVESIEFDDQTRWTNICGYTINLKTNKFTESSNGIFSANATEDAFSYYISDAQESWSISEADSLTASSGNALDEKKTYSISHTVSAVGQRTYNSGVLVSPVSQASGYVHNVLGIGSGNIPSSFFNLPSGLVACNRKVSEEIDRLAGSYQIQEEFTFLPSGQLATESVQFSIENDTSSLKRISVNGTITGMNSLGATDRSTNRYINASSYWASVSGQIYNRASGNYDDIYLNPIPLSKSIGKNPQEGTITYNYSFDNRPANFIANALTEDIQVTDTYPGQNINVVPVIGRSQPIIQYVNSRSEYRRSLSITANLPASGGLVAKPSISELTAIFDFYKPIGNKVYYEAPTENWNPRTGQYSYSINWVFEGPSLVNNY
jgi:hypothetical protein